MTNRNCLYFDVPLGPYLAGEWYDNVPDDDFAVAVDLKLARIVDTSPACGCALVGGRAVRVGLRGEIYCGEHLDTALRPPASTLSAVKMKKARVTLLEHARKAGLA